MINTSWIRKIWQGGMGVDISNWILARESAMCGGTGTTSSALADQVLVRILQNGDPGGHFRRALSNFPFLRNEVDDIIEKYYVPLGNPVKYKFAKPLSLNSDRESILLVVLANYCNVYLAKEGHSNPIAINIMEKLQLPLMYAVAGAMIAGVDIIAVGAGLPLQIPDVIDAIANGKVASYSVLVEDLKEKVQKVEFDFASFFGCKIRLNKPKFVPIVSVHNLAEILFSRLEGRIDGFIVENWTAGGHNAPPRGKFELTEKGEPKYGERDNPDFEAFRRIGLPFWLAGGYATPEALEYALSVGACGVQLGSIFALCNESGMRPDLRTEVIHRLQTEEVFAFTDPYASPTGFPFKTVNVGGTMGEIALMHLRKSRCDLGALVRPHKKENGEIGYRCPAEPIGNFISKGGKQDSTYGTVCLCNGLLNNTNLTDKKLPAVITLGLNTDFIKRVIKPGATEYSVRDVFDYMLSV